MNVIREIRKVDTDTIEIKLPEDFRERELEIIVFPLEEREQDSFSQGELKLTSYKCYGKKQDFNRSDAYNDGI